jgi:uncharacterized membrane protein
LHPAAKAGVQTMIAAVTIVMILFLCMVTSLHDHYKGYAISFQRRAGLFLSISLYSARGR